MIQIIYFMRKKANNMISLQFILTYTMELVFIYH